MISDRRGLLSRAFDVCLGAFVAAWLLYGAVQLVLRIRWWLVGGLLVAALLTASAKWFRARQGRW